MDMHATVATCNILTTKDGVCVGVVFFFMAGVVGTSCVATAFIILLLLRILFLADIISLCKIIDLTSALVLFPLTRLV